MKKTNKRGFTIVELVIVIAVIAILAAVLIPTFSGIVKKANIAADTQLCKNMNTALAIAESEGTPIETMEDVLFTINAAGYIIENLNPTTEGYYYAWDSEQNQILFLDDQLEVHFQSKAEVGNRANWWVTVSTADEIQAVAATGSAIYLENDITDAITLTNIISIDTGIYTIADLKIQSTAETNAIVATLKGTYGTLEIDAPNGEFTQFGTVDTLNATAVKDGTLTINGYVKTLSLTKGRVAISSKGVVDSLTVAETGATAENAGIVGAVTGTLSTNTGWIINEQPTAPEGFVYSIGTRVELLNFANMVNTGASFKGVTVQLTADIDLAGYAWTPIGNFTRTLNITDADGKNLANHSAGFNGIFDGANHTITNLSNEGFSIGGVVYMNNSSTPVGHIEFIYGLFGCVIDAEIKNLNMTNVNLTAVRQENDKLISDSVAAIVGYAGGDTFTMSNCTVNGNISGYDSVAGLVGRSYARNTTTISNCTNNATITAVRRAAGIMGYVHASNNTTMVATIENCTNNGNVSNIGTGKTDPAGNGTLKLEKDGVTVTFSGTWYYTASGIVARAETHVTITDCTNNATVTSAYGEQNTGDKGLPPSSEFSKDETK